MAVTNLNKVDALMEGLDSIVIVRDLADIPSGKSLDVSAFVGDVIMAGHVLVMNKETKEVSPLAVSEGAYAALPEGCEYYGINKVSITKGSAMAAILRIGTVNAAAAGKAVAPITEDIKAGLPHIDFIN